MKLARKGLGCFARVLAGTLLGLLLIGLGVLLVAWLVMRATTPNTVLTPLPAFATPHGYTVEAKDCASLAIPHGWSLGWRWLNHRVSAISWAYESTAGSHSDVCVPNWAVGTMVGGDFSTGEVLTDQIHFAVHDTVVTLPDPLRAARVRVRLATGTDGLGSATYTIPLADLGMPLGGATHWSAFLAGMGISTDQPTPDGDRSGYAHRLGFTTRGTGATAHVTAADATALTLTTTVRLEHGVAPDAGFRDDLNAAIPFSRSEAFVDVWLVPSTVAAHPTPEVARGSFETNRRYGWTRDREPRPHPQLGPLATSTVIGLTGWDLQLTYAAGCGPAADCVRNDRCVDGVCVAPTGDAGDYVREFGVAVLPSDGRWAGAGWASTASVAFAMRPLVYAWEVGYTPVPSATVRTYRSAEGGGGAGQWRSAFVVLGVDAAALPGPPNSSPED